MGLRQRFADIISGGALSRNIQQVELLKASLAPRHFLEDNNLPYREDSYRLVNGEDFLTLYENHVPTYACVDAIARNCAKIPMKLYRKDMLEAGKKKHEAEVGQYDKDEVASALWKLFMHPNPWQTNFEFRYALIATAELTGMAYIEKTGADEMKTMLPEQLWVLRTDWMRTIPSQTDLIEKYLYQTITGAYVEYQRNEIFEYKYWHPRSEFYGLSPVRPAQNSIIVDLYCIKYAKQFFKNGGHISKYVSIKEKLTDPEFKRMASEIQTFMGGLENAHKIPLMEGGGELKEIGENPEGAALPKTRSMNLDDICQTFGVPPIVLGLPNTTHYNNAEVQKKVFYEETVIPKNIKLLASLNQTFLEPLGFIMDLDYSGIDVLQPNIEKKANTSAKLVSAHIMTPNEIRKEFWALDPIAGGDEFPAIQTPGMGGGTKEQFSPENTDAGTEKKLDPDTVDLIDKMVSLKLAKAIEKEGMTTTSMAAAMPTGTMAGENHGKPSRKMYRGKGRPRKYLPGIKKAHVASADKLYSDIYPAMENAVLNGWKSLKKATIDAVHSFKKSAIVVRKDYVEQVMGIMDTETLKMAKDLIKAQKEQVDRIVASEQARTGKKIPKSKMDSLRRDLENRLEETVSKGMGSVSDTIKDRVSKRIEDMIDNGKSPAELADSINEAFGGDDYGHAKTIARTETIKFVNTSRMEALNGMGFTKKQWFHSGHENAREDHLADDGEVVDMDAVFPNSGLLYPGDPSAGPEDVCNCGCTFAEYVPSVLTDEEIADLEDQGDE